MFTSVTERKFDARQKLILIDLCAALFCAVFGAVYEHFGHGVYSYGMIYAFAFPLVLGVLPFMLITMYRATYPNRLARGAYHAGIAALTVGSLVSGALEIYGTTNPLTIVYWIAGGALAVFGIAIYLVSLFRRTEKGIKTFHAVDAMPAKRYHTDDETTSTAAGRQPDGGGNPSSVKTGYETENG